MEEDARSPSAYYINLYSEFRAAVDRLPVRAEMMPYGWHSMPSGISPIWLTYEMTLNDFAMELANIVNALTLNVTRLYAWAEVVEVLSDDGKLCGIAYSAG